MGRDLHPVRITGNKRNMWAEREKKRKLAKQQEVEEAFLQRFQH